MTRRRWTAVAAVIGVLAMTPTLAGAAPLTAADYDRPAGLLGFCADAQVDVANVNESAMRSAGISITSVVYDDWDDFVLSKSAVDADAKQIVTTAHVQYRDRARVRPQMYRCKLRTGESIAKGAWPGGAANNEGRFAVDPRYGFGRAARNVSSSNQDQPCRVVNERTIDNVWDSLTGRQRAAAPFSPEGRGSERTLVTTADEVVGSGPAWTASVAPVRRVGDVLEVGSRALVVPTGTAAPRFEGAHYCTLVAPQHLRDILLGDVRVG